MKRIFLLLIMLLAFVLRFYRLGDYPALNADEAAIGYNAYSLLETGKDEHGNPWPVHFQSFNDYKPGLYFYLVLPFVKILGLNEWAVRIPGAFLGVLTVYIVYLLTNELFKKEKFGLPLEPGIFASLLLAVSPWHIHFSRGGWEVNIATFFITTGVWLFLRALKKPNVLNFVFSFLSFALALYSYHAARIIIPLLLLGLFLNYRNEVIKNARNFIIAGIVGVVILLPLLKDLAGPAGLSRAAGVGLFADPGPINRVNEQRGEHDNLAGLSSKILHNKPVNYTLTFVGNWTKHFWGEFLFLSGDEIQRNRVPETGLLYLYQFPLLVIGLWFIVRNFNKECSFVIWWLLIAPVAAALTFQSPHALRAHNMVIPLTIISAYGIIVIAKWLNGYRRFKILGYFIVGVLTFWSFLRYGHMYWIHMSKEYPFSSQYGIKELVSYISKNSRDYKKFVITDRYDQPYILFLFYLKYPPEKFQRDHVLTPRDRYGFSTVREFDKYTFTSIQPWDEIRETYRDSLIAGTPEEIFPASNVVENIFGQNGKLYFRIVAN